MAQWPLPESISLLSFENNDVFPDNENPEASI
jgi:hypothetical protein